MCTAVGRLSYARREGTGWAVTRVKRGYSCLIDWVWPCWAGLRHSDGAGGDECASVGVGVWIECTIYSF